MEQEDKESMVKHELELTVTHFRSVIDHVKAYFDGIHFGDITALRSIFHEDAVLKAPGVRRSLEEWFEAIESRPIPAEQGTAYLYDLLSIEIIGDQAMVKIYCPLLGQEYIDHLGLLYEDGQWLIVNKMYADRRPAV